MFKAIFTSLTVFLSLNSAYAGMGDIIDVRDYHRYQSFKFTKEELVKPSRAKERFEKLQEKYYGDEEFTSYEFIIKWTEKLCEQSEKFQDQLFQKNDQLRQEIVQMERKSAVLTLLKVSDQDELIESAKILAPYIRDCYSTSDECGAFISGIRKLVINGQNLGVFIEKMEEITLEGEKYVEGLRRKGIRHGNPQHMRLHGFLENGQKLFRLVGQLDLDIYEALLVWMNACAQKNEFSPGFRQLITKLHNDGHGSYSTQLRDFYAQTLVLSKKTRIKGCKLYEEMVGADLELAPDNVFQTSFAYTQLARFYGEQNELDKAIKCYLNVVVLENRGLTKNSNKRLTEAIFNLAGVYAIQETQDSLQKAVNYLEDLQGGVYGTLQTVLLAPLEHNLLLIYQRMGNTDKASEILVRRQKKFLEEDFPEIQKKKAEKRKEMQRFLEARNRKLPARSSRTKPTKPATSLSPGVSDSGQTPVVYDYTTPPPARGYSAPVGEPKKKVKTRGKADPVREAPLPSESEVVQENVASIEEVLLTSPQHYQTFCKLFRSVEEGISANKVKISMHDIETLLKAMGQDFDKSAGKGSHTKVTLNFEEFEISGKEQMLVLSKKTYLLPYQIVMLREAFVGFGLYPKYMADRYTKTATAEEQTEPTPSTGGS